MTDSSTEKNVVVTRVFDAPVERVWKAWTDAGLVMRWWGPAGFTAPLARMDFREGGASLVCMRSPQGQDYYNLWICQKIVSRQRIEFIQAWATKDGQRVGPVEAGMPPDFPQEVPTRVTFRDVGEGKTEMAVTEYGYPEQGIADLSKAGLEQCLDKMAALFGGW